MHLPGKTVGTSSCHQSTTYYIKWKHTTPISKKKEHRWRQTGTPHNQEKQQFYSIIKNLTNIKFTKEEIEVWVATWYWEAINFIFLQPRNRNWKSHKTTRHKITEYIPFYGTKKLKQIPVISSGNHHIPLQNRLCVIKQLNHKLVTENVIIVQADKGKVIINSEEYSKIVQFPSILQRSLQHLSKTYTENITTMHFNHRQTKDKIPNPKETFTTNTTSTTKST
jgi:hypothetical protein